MLSGQLKELKTLNKRVIPSIGQNTVTNYEWRDINVKTKNEQCS